MATNRTPPLPTFLDFKTDAERDAYFLGFFFADGYNNEKQGRVVISLAQKDEDFLQMLSDAIHGQKRSLLRWQNKSRHIVCMSISSRYLSRKIASLGAPQKKTFLIRWPTFFPYVLLRHFVRGYFDGDGSCLEASSKDCAIKRRAIHIAGTLDFLTGLSAYVQSQTGLKGGIVPIGNICLYHIGGNRQSSRFMTWLYQDARFYLPRKRDRGLVLAQDLERLDTNKTYVFYDRKRDVWSGRLPLKYGRRCSGCATTKEEAVQLWKEAMAEIERTSFGEWLNKRPIKTRGPTRKHVKERGIAEGRYLRKNKV